MLTCKFCWVQFWHSSQEVRMGDIVYQRHVGRGVTEEDKPYLGWHCSMSCALFHLTVSIQVAFFLAHKQAWGPTCLWSRAAEASGWAATSHNVLPGIRATRLHLDASCFFVQHVPWQFFISLVLLRHHAECRKEAQQIGAEIIFFNPGYKSQQMERILVLEVACRHLWCCWICHTLTSDILKTLQWCCLSHLLHLDHSRMRDLEHRVLHGGHDLVWVHCNSGVHRAPQVAGFLRSRATGCSYFTADTWMN